MHVCKFVRKRERVCVCLHICIIYVRRTGIYLCMDLHACTRIVHAGYRRVVIACFVHTHTYTYIRTHDMQYSHRSKSRRMKQTPSSVKLCECEFGNDATAADSDRILACESLPFDLSLRRTHSHKHTYTHTCKWQLNIISHKKAKFLLF